LKSCQLSKQSTVRTNAIIDEVEDVVLSQEGNPQAHSTQRQISRQTGISLGGFSQYHFQKGPPIKLVSKAQKLTGVNKLARLRRCRQLLKGYPASTINFVWFTDEKLFSVAAPSNTQNDRIRINGNQKEERSFSLAENAANLQQVTDGFI